MSIVRWTLTDTANGNKVTVSLNPNKMDAPPVARNMEWAWGSRAGQDQMRGIDQVPSAAPNWTFGGYLNTQAHYDLLLSWTKRLSVLRVTDHLGRTFEMIIQKFDPVERLPTVNTPLRVDYTMTCLYLKEVTA